MELNHLHKKMKPTLPLDKELSSDIKQIVNNFNSKKKRMYDMVDKFLLDDLKNSTTRSDYRNSSRLDNDVKVNIESFLNGLTQSSNLTQEPDYLMAIRNASKVSCSTDIYLSIL